MTAVTRHVTAVTRHVTAVTRHVTAVEALYLSMDDIASNKTYDSCNNVVPVYG